jgi:hypothetical protein
LAASKPGPGKTSTPAFDIRTSAPADSSAAFIASTGAKSLLAIAASRSARPLSLQHFKHFLLIRCQACLSCVEFEQVYHQSLIRTLFVEIGKSPDELASLIFYLRL